MQGKAARQAGFPGEPFDFEVSPDPGHPDDAVHWSGGGEPAGGTGRRFRTSFDTGRTFGITATSGAESVTFEVVICPLDAWLVGAREFYGPSIDFSRVRVASSRVVFGPHGSAWTCNNVVRFKRPRRVADLPHESTLIHELGHVWEHQTGQLQLLGGLVEQVGRRFGKDPYDYGGPEGVARADRLKAFKKEGQAQILTEYWKATHGHEKDRMQVPFSTPGYVENLRRLLEGAGIGTLGASRRGLGRVLDSAVAGIANALVGVLE